MVETLKWMCEGCGKVIESLYPKQLKQNKQSHLDNCKKREVGTND